MPANLENSAVATALEKVSFHSNPKERQCQRMLRLLHKLQSMGLLRVGHDWATSLSLFTFMHWRHSSVLAWRIPWTGEPGGLPSMGSHRVGHDLAAAAAHTSKVMLKILQARLQHYVNHELPDVQDGFRKGRGTRDQIAKIHWIIKKVREFQKNIYFCFFDYTEWCNIEC